MYALVGGLVSSLVPWERSMLSWDEIELLVCVVEEELFLNTFLYSCSCVSLSVSCREYVRYLV